MKTIPTALPPAGQARLQDRKHAHSFPFHQPRRSLTAKAWGLLSFLWFCAGLSTVFAANLLTNPGFEDGQTGWSNPNLVRGGTSLVITAPALAHSGNNCISNNNPTGWSSAQQGDSMGGWGTGVSLPVSPANYYKLSAWVKVPGASTTPQAITLRYRFEPSGARVDVGTKTIDTENWTQLETGWIQPPPGDSFMSYWEVHSLNNGVIFYADDCALDESTPLSVEGRVVDGGGAGVDGANVTASSTAYTTPTTTTSGGGYYYLSVPAGTYKVAANTPGFKGSVTHAVTTSPTTVPNIVLVTDPDYDPELIFSALSSAITVGSPWPTVNPAGGVLTPMNGPSVQSFGGVQWEKNVADGPGYLFGTYTDPIPVNGASIVVAAKPKRMPSNNWDSIVDVFFNRLGLCVNNGTGLIQVWANGTLTTLPAATAIPDGQVTILSLVVQPTGEYVVFANGTPVYTNLTTSDMTYLTPGGAAHEKFINVGRNNPDGWTTFNGNIGDVYLYKVALDDAKRVALQNSLMTKFITNATLSYTITASAAANGSISPVGATSVVQGYDKTYTITANSGYVVSTVLVDGVSVGAVTSYTFSNVSANHTIAASFVAMPPQTITASSGPNGTISPIGSVSVAAGSDQTFLMTPAPGYAVASVLVNGVSQGEIYSYTFPFVIAPHTISVTFRLLDMPVPKADQLIFSAVTDSLPADTLPTGNWATYVPLGKTLSVLGVPTVEVISGVKWQKNVAFAPSDGYQWPGPGAGGAYTAPIPCSGATIMVVAKPISDTSLTGPWDSLVDVFYDRLVLGIKNDTGEVVVRYAGAGATVGPVIPYAQSTILSMVVQPDGTYNVWANAALVMSGSGPALTALTPGAAGHEKFINVGRNQPDGWTAFNGNIGDVFLYKTALTTAERETLQSALAAKFGIVLPVFTTVSGKVTLMDGTTPVAGATVTAMGVPGTYTATTAGDGTYAVTVEGNASYQVDAAKASYSTPASQNITVVVTPVTGVNFMVRLITAITGTVKTGAGVPIPNAVVQVGEGGPAAVADSSGNYTVTSINIGAGVSFYADALGFGEYTETIDTSAAAAGVITKDVVLAAKVEADYSYIQNGGFETGALPPWVGDNNATIETGVTTAEKASGSYSGYWQSKPGVDYYQGYLRQFVTVVAGSTYNIYWKLKTPNTGNEGQSGFDFMGVNGDGNLESTAWWGYDGQLASSGNNWLYTPVPGVWEQTLNYRNWNNSEKLLAVRVTPPPGTVAIQIIAGLGTTTAGQLLYVDDVVVDRVGPAAPPLAPAITLPDGVPTFTFPTMMDHSYRIVYKQALTDAAWTPLGTWAPADGTPITLTDSSAPPLQAQRFYRLEVR
jgi:hypothetical protein